MKHVKLKVNETFITVYISSTKVNLSKKLASEMTAWCQNLHFDLIFQE